MNRKQQRRVGGNNNISNNNGSNSSGKNSSKHNYCPGCQRRGHRLIDCPYNKHINENNLKNNNNNNIRNNDDIGNDDADDITKTQQQQTVPHHATEIVVIVDYEKENREVVEHNNEQKGVSSTSNHQQHQEEERKSNPTAIRKSIVPNDTISSITEENYNRKGNNTSQCQHDQIQHDDDNKIVMTMMTMMMDKMENMIRTTIHNEMQQHVIPTISRIVQQEISKNYNKSIIQNNTSTNASHDIFNDRHGDFIIRSDSNENYKINTTTTMSSSSTSSSPTPNCDSDINDNTIDRSMMMMKSIPPSPPLPPVQQSQQKQHDRLSDDDDDDDNDGKNHNDTSVIILPQQQQQQYANENSSINQQQQQQESNLSIKSNSNEVCSSSHNNSENNIHIMKMRMMLDHDYDDKSWDDDSENDIESTENNENSEGKGQQQLNHSKLSNYHAITTIMKSDHDDDNEEDRKLCDDDNGKNDIVVMIPQHSITNNHDVNKCFPKVDDIDEESDHRQNHNNKLLSTGRLVGPQEDKNNVCNDKNNNNSLNKNNRNDDDRLVVIIPHQQQDNVTSNIASENHVIDVEIDDNWNNDTEDYKEVSTNHMLSPFEDAWYTDEDDDDDLSVIPQQHTNFENKSHQVSSNHIEPLIPNDESWDYDDDDDNTVSDNAPQLHCQLQQLALKPTSFLVPPPPIPQVSAMKMTKKATMNKGTKRNIGRRKRKGMSDNLKATMMMNSRSPIKHQRNSNYGVDANNNNITNANGLSTKKQHIHRQCKKYTHRFQLGIQKVVPPNIYTNIERKYGKSCAFFENIVNYISKHSIPVSSEIFDDLKAAIKYRRKASAMYHDDKNNIVKDDDWEQQNKSHQHFISVLENCWSTLITLARIDDVPSYMNRTEFCAFAFVCEVDCGLQQQQQQESSGSDEETSKNESEEKIPLSTSSLSSTSMIYHHDVGGYDCVHNNSHEEDDVMFGPPIQPQGLSIQEHESVMLKDQSDCMLFLGAIEDMMRSIAQKYVSIRQTFSCLDIEQKLIDAAVFVNQTIRNVVSLEETFVSEHPHLNTIYRFFIRLMYTDHIKDFIKLMSEISPLFSTNMQQQQQEKHAIAFLSTLLECAICETIPLEDFDNSDDENTTPSKASKIIDDYVLHWKITDKKPMYDMLKIFQDDVVLKEPLTTLETERWLKISLQRMSSEAQKTLLLDSLGFHLGRCYSFIGNHRRILRTIRCLQTLAYLKSTTATSKPSHNNFRFAIEAELYGPSWENVSTNYNFIPFCMDDLLMSDIMPTLINMCLEGLISLDVPPHEQYCMAVFQQIKEYAQYPNRPVTWSIAFTVHAILISIFEMYDKDNENNRVYPIYLSRIARSEFYRYCDQIELLLRKDCNHHEMQQTMQNQPSYRLLVDVPMKECLLQKSIDHAIWNPLCAGTFLSYVKYILELQQRRHVVEIIL